MGVVAPASGPAVPGAAVAVVRRLYDAWNRADLAAAADCLDPSVRWDTFQGGDEPRQGPGGLRETMVAGVGSGATWVFAGVVVDLLVEAGAHVIALCRRSGAHAARLEVWTVRDGRVARFRGFPVEDGLAVLSNTTGSSRLEALCRGLAAHNRRDVEGWLALFHPDAMLMTAQRRSYAGHAGLRRWLSDVDAQGPGARIDDVVVRAECEHALVLSAEQRAAVAAEPLELVVAFEGELVRWIAAYPTAEQALAVARGL